jgi:chromate transport protein ChrA
MKSFYQFAVAAVIGAMFSVILKMLVTNLKDGIDVLFFLSAVILLFWKKWPAWLIIPLFGLISLMIGDPWKF